MIEFTCQRCGKQDTVGITIYPSTGVVPHKMTVCSDCYRHLQTIFSEIVEGVCEKNDQT